MENLFLQEYATSGDFSRADGAGFGGRNYLCSPAAVGKRKREHRDYCVAADVRLDADSPPLKYGESD